MLDKDVVYLLCIVMLTWYELNSKLPFLLNPVATKLSKQKPTCATSCEAHENREDAKT